MKKFLRDYKSVFFSIVFAATVSFMLFTVEPISLYANNVNDFWFDLYTILPSTLLFTIISFAIILVILLITFFISKVIKKPNLFNIFYLIAFTVFLIAYIHGNFFSGSLPTFNGEPIIWSSYTTEHIISSIICLIVIIAVVFASIKLKPSRVAKYASFITAAIFLMLSVSFLSTIATTDALKEKTVHAYATNDNLNTYSSESNFLILLLDAVDSERFYKTVGNSDLYKETFTDFTYFPDTVGAYNLTRDSIPFIFSGKWDYNETDFITYSTDAYDNSPLFKKLKASNYEMNFYEDSLIWQSRKAFDFANVTGHTKNINRTSLLKQDIKYILFKYLPYPLKKYSKADSIDFSITQPTEDKTAFEWDNILNYNNIQENPIELTSNKVFQFLHLEGAHVPYNMDKDLNIIDVETGTYEQKCMATLKLINAYINRLKDSGVYDNSSIIIMADHGVNYVANPNPILYIKGINEHHPYQSSDKALWYPDLLEAYNELLAGENSSELFTHVTDEHRDRIIIQIPFQHEDHMIEWVQTGKAWDKETLSKTGRVFDL